MLRETTNGLELPLIAQKKLAVCCHEIPGPTSNSFDTSRRRWTGSQISFASELALSRGTGSATPLAWSLAQFIRLVVCVKEKRIVEQPAVVADHFLKQSSQKTVPSARRRL